MRVSLCSWSHFCFLSAHMLSTSDLMLSACFWSASAFSCFASAFVPAWLALRSAASARASSLAFFFRYSCSILSRVLSACVLVACFSSSLSPFSMLSTFPFRSLREACIASLLTSRDFIAPSSATASCCAARCSAMRFSRRCSCSISTPRVASSCCSRCSLTCATLLSFSSSSFRTSARSRALFTSSKWSSSSLASRRFWALAFASYLLAMCSAFCMMSSALCRFDAVSSPSRTTDFALVE
mmetsp:Transcript_37604/g.88905  ORF Transcript_37604/g.88905 Transcript_37604/m.88905 type:complete len:241 (-) Transcript_37604:169-891(-)